MKNLTTTRGRNPRRSSDCALHGASEDNFSSRRSQRGLAQRRSGVGGYRGMALVELAPDVTLDEIAAKTEATYRVALD